MVLDIEFLNYSAAGAQLTQLGAVFLGEESVGTFFRPIVVRDDLARLR
jgi:hypothetical protein